MKQAVCISLSLISLTLPAFAQVDTEALPKVEEGFEINFFVKEPYIINPSALCFDRHGRLYVGAGPQYRSPKADSPTDYIKILIDADQDGVAETVKTFAEGFNSVQGMAWKGNELWVANAPELTVLRDTDGDDVADEYQVIYTGLNNLRHSLHGLIWGPDGWLYMSMGNTWVEKNAPKPFRDLQGIQSDDNTVYPLTEVYTRDTYPKTYHAMNKREMEGGIFRCRPGGHDLELYARGMRNPWDICMDSGFNWVGTDNDPGRPAERIFMPVPYAHYSMRHPWMFDWMGKHIATAPASDLFPGVSGSGTGVAFYTANHFPERYRNQYLIADWTNNCLFFYPTKWDGALQVPAETKRKLIDGGTTRGGDLGWKGGQGRALFRPTDIEVGPDGALYLAGWGSVYGTAYVPKERWTPEENAKYQGRVFRMRHTEADLIPRKTWHPAKRDQDIKTWSFEELIEDIGHQVQVWRVHAQDEVVRRGKEVRDELVEVIDSGRLTETQATWSIWALGHIDRGTDCGDLADYATGKRKGALNLRIQAARILGENKTGSDVLIRLLDDPEPRVRLAAIQSLGRTGWGDRTREILDAVADETDRLTLYTAWQVMRRQTPVEFRRRLLGDPRGGIRLMAALSLMEDRKADAAEIFVLRDDPDPRLSKLAGEWLQKTGAQSATVEILATEINFREKAEFRIKASGKFDIHYTLDGTTPSRSAKKFSRDFELSEDATIKAAAFGKGGRISKIETLAVHRITESEWKDRLFVRNVRASKAEDLYPVMDDGLQRGVLVYTGESATITSVPDEIAGATVIRTSPRDRERGDAEFLSFDLNVPAKVFVAYDVRHAPPKWLEERFSKTKHRLATSAAGTFQVYEKEYAAGTVVLGGNRGSQGDPLMYQVYVTRSGAKKTSADEVSNALAKADPKHGEELFFGRGTCFACHKVKGKGIAVGPDLVGLSKRQSMKHVIDSILTPDLYITEGFQQTSLELQDGRKLYGMIQEETAQTIQIFLLTGEQVRVKAAEVKKREDAKHSGMPSSFAYTLDARDVADLSAWIMSLQ